MYDFSEKEVPYSYQKSSSLNKTFPAKATQQLSTEPLAFELIPELSLGPESSLVYVQV